MPSMSGGEHDVGCVGVERVCTGYYLLWCNQGGLPGKGVFEQRLGGNKGGGRQLRIDCPRHSSGVLLSN